MVPLEAFDFWLDCANVEAVTAAALLTAPCKAREISIAVDRVANDRPPLLEPIPNLRHRPAYTHHAGDRGSSDEWPCQTREEDKKDERQTSLF